jgi:hypothetical protein
MALDEQEIVGEWNVSFQGPTRSWKWEYTFSADRTLNWRDPLNNLMGSGRWQKQGKDIIVSWDSSTTDEKWYCPIKPREQKGRINASYGEGEFQAQKIVAGAEELQAATQKGDYSTIDIDRATKTMKGPTALLGGLSDGYSRWLNIQPSGTLIPAEGPPQGKPVSIGFLGLTFADKARRLLVLRQGWSIGTTGGDVKDAYVEVWWRAHDERELELLNNWVKSAETQDWAYGNLMRPVADDAVLKDIMKQELAALAAGIAVAGAAAVAVRLLTRFWSPGRSRGSAGVVDGGEKPVVPTVRPRATLSQLRELLGKPNLFVWGTTDDSADIARNQTIKFTGRNTPPGAPPGVYLSRLGKSGPGVNSGNYYVVIDGSKYQINPTKDAMEFRLNGEIPAEDGLWFTREDMKKL